MPGQDLLQALQEHDMFVYCGHGCAQQYISLAALRELPSCSAAFLMGCSSGRLSKKGCYEASGPIQAYIQGGQPLCLDLTHCVIFQG